MVSKASSKNLNRFWIGVTALTAIVSGVVLVLYLLTALQWWNRPFIGTMLTPLLAVDNSQPLANTPWAGLEAGLQPMDRIVAIDGEALYPLNDEGRFDPALPVDYEAIWANFHRVIAGLDYGQRVQVEFEREGAQCEQAGNIAACQLSYTVDHFVTDDLVGFFGTPFITALVTYFIGLTVLLLRPNQAAGRLISIIAFTLAIMLAGLFDIETTHRLIPLWLVANLVLAAALATFGLVFPSRSLILFRFPFLEYLPFVLSAVAIPVFLWFYFQPPSADFEINLYATFTVVLGVGILVMTMLRQRYFAPSARVRDQSNTILIGLFLMSVPLLIWLANVLIQYTTQGVRIPFNTAAAAPFIMVVPLSLAYALLQYRFMDTDQVISQGITYGIMLAALIAGYSLLVFSVSLVLTDSAPANSPLLIGVTIFGIAVFFLPVRTFLQRQIDRLYFRQRHNFQQHVEDFTHTITQSRSVEQVSDEFRSLLVKTIGCSNLFVFVPDRQTGHYVAIGNPVPETDLSFEPNSGLIQTLAKQDQPIFLEPTQQWPHAVRAERPRLKILHSSLVVGLHSGDKLNGFVSVGPPQSGKGTYTHDELVFIQNLVRQLSIALERAQVVESLQHRVRELDVLSQVGQAVNFAINLDDLMELLSAQTNRLIEATYFYIALRDEHSHDLYFAFFLENDERYPNKENQPWPIGSDLFSEVVRTGQPKRVSNYGAAMAQRNVPIMVESPDLLAWMCVPLTAGAHTLGAMAVGTTETGKTYGDDQFRIFSDISSLAATSIEKARLFAETAKRTNQLAALNDVSNQLASAQQDLSKLLELITNSAVDILESEAGSLLLTAIDDPDELEFTIAVGAVGQDLVGKRFPAKQGLAGDVVKTGKYVIVNDATNDPRWAGEKASVGFQTTSILAVPLMTNQQILGVLEVLNKHGRSNFTEEDANLLTTFASQAAIAIDNARLFQMTDQQLGDRVQELETLERIDVELNRSLDIKKVADLTMRWAIAQSGATAGVLGLVVGDPPVLEIIARYGYRDEELEEDYRGSAWPLNRGIISRVMRTHQPDLASDIGIDPDYIPGQRHSLSQITVPMMQGKEIVAILVLEKNTEPRLNLVDLAFVNRLTEHAIIALINAQLYVDLARANDSKSEFVSFVAHELKTPMTSIKGYTDLLLGGVTGEVNDQQENFLGTIKSNIERMNTLVSDLNDVTKLQTNNFHMEMAHINVRDVVNDTLRGLQQQMEEKIQTLELHMPDDLPPIVADQNRLIQVLTNLLSNAHKYTPTEGQIQVVAEVSDNQLNSKNEDNQPVLHIYVKDTGIGMSEEDLAKLFTPYFRSDNPAAREQPGTGLGLTITRGIVERHGGHIWVESELGEGTAFHFTVPLAAEKQASPSEQ